MPARFSLGCVFLIFPQLVSGQNYAIQEQYPTVQDSAIADAIVSSANPDMPLGVPFSCTGTAAYNAIGVGHEYGSASPFCPVPKGVIHSYIRWDLDTIPQGHVVWLATVNFHGAGGISSATIRVTIARVLENWDETSLTWNNAPSSDTAETTFTVDQDGNSPQEIDITSIVRHWYSNPSSNYGIVLYESPPGVSGNNVKFWGSHDNTIGKRPPILTTDFVTSVKGETQPFGFRLLSNYPNPFNGVTRISLSLPNRQHVSIKIYDVLGREVSTLVDANLSPDFHSFIWDANNYPTGSYFCRAIGEHYSSSLKLLLLK